MVFDFKKFKNALGVSLITILSSIGYSQQCESLVTGDWGNVNTWSCDGVNRIPTCGDTILVRSGNTVSVTNQYNLQACGLPIILDVTGILQFSNGNKLELPCNSILSIQTGGIVRKSTAGGGSSTLISICNSNIWTAGDGPLNGPISYGGEILPVELIRFEGEINGSDAELKWSTATEHNNDYFSIYRSEDDVNWLLAQVVLASGNSNVRNDYSVIVSNVETNTLFKLEQTDFDGSEEALGIIELSYTQVKEDKQFSVYPNPTSNKIYFKGLPKNFSGSFSLLGLGGNVVYQSSLDANNQGIDLDQLGLESGVYSGVIASALRSETVKISLIF